MSINSPEFRRWSKEIAAVDAADAAAAARDRAAIEAADQLQAARELEKTTFEQRLAYVTQALERRAQFTNDLAKDIGDKAHKRGIEPDMKVGKRKFFSGEFVVDLSGWNLEQKREESFGPGSPDRVHGHFLTPEGEMYKYDLIDNYTGEHWRRPRYSVRVGVREESYMRSYGGDDYREATRRDDVTHHESVKGIRVEKLYLPYAQDLAHDPNPGRLRALEARPNNYDTMLVRFARRKLGISS